jgi:uncharacterized protein (TIGR04206 family)
MGRRARAAAAAVAGLLPWLVVSWEHGAYPLFSFGFVYTESLSLTTLPAYLDAVGSVPPQFRAWPVATAVWLAGVACAVLDVDRRVTAGLLAIAGWSVVSLAVALSGQRTVTAYPVGAVFLLAAAAGVYVDVGE